jgi:DNA-binding NarL/FixJ family response regulator
LKKSSQLTRALKKRTTNHYIMREKFPVALIEQNSELRLTLNDKFKHSALLDCIINVDSIERFCTLYHKIQPKELKLILLDSSLLNYKRASVINRLNKNVHNSKIIIFSANDPDHYFHDHLKKGVSGFLLKSHSFPELEALIHEAIADNQKIICTPEYKHLFQVEETPHFYINNTKLNNAEYLVCSRLMNGHEYKFIANEMGISVDGVRYYVRNVYRKLKVNSKWELIRKCRLRPPGNNGSQANAE